MPDRLGSLTPNLEQEAAFTAARMTIATAAPGLFGTTGATTFRSPGFLARHAVGLMVILSFLTLAAPFLSGEIPPLTDYPNHLARYWLIAGGVRAPELATYYQIDWFNAVTNVGVDRVVWLLSPFASALTLGRLATVAAAVLPPLGVLALNRAITPRVTAWQALFPIAAWSTTFLMGFLNFQIGLGLALLFASMDPLVQSRLWRGAVAMRIPCGLILAADHLFGLMFYGVLLAGLGMGAEPLRPWEWRAVLLRLRRAAFAGAWCLIPLAITVTHRALPGGQASAQTVNTSIQYNVMPGKLATLFSLLASYNVFQELVLALALVGLFVWLNRRRALTAHTGLMVATAGLVALAVLAPSRAGGATWIDRRFPIMALFCGLAALQLRPNLSRSFAVAVAATSLGLACLQSAWVGWNWQAMERDMRAVRQVLAEVPAGAQNPSPATRSVPGVEVARAGRPLHVRRGRRDVPAFRRLGRAVATRLRAEPVFRPRPAASQGAGRLGQHRRAQWRRPGFGCRAQPRSPGRRSLIHPGLAKPFRLCAGAQR